MIDKISTRRAFLITGAAILPGVFELGASAAESKPEKMEDVTPTEDLMREHGALNRILLIYDEAARRIRTGKSVEPQIVTDAANLIRTFIEHYHEENEEKHIFPHFDKANKFTDLVATLKKQHDAGREVTTQILADAKSIKTRGEQLATMMEAFNRMYRPHEAREDTVLYPAFRSVVSAKVFDELGDQFEDTEQKLFGKNGFEHNVEKIAELEKQLGIYELAQFTPHVPTHNDKG